MYVCRKNKVENKFKVKLQTNILKQATKTLLKSKTITAGCVNEAKGWLKGMRQMPELCAKYRKNWSGKFEFLSGKSQGILLYSNCGHPGDFISQCEIWHVCVNKTPFVSKMVIWVDICLK